MGWFAPSQWRVSSIRSVLGETSEHAVRVYKPRKQDVSQREVEHVTLQLGEYATALLSGEAARRDMYWAMYKPDLPTERSKLEAAVRLDSVERFLGVEAAGEGSPLSLWLGPPGHREQLHYDDADNLHMQLAGRKQWSLFPPACKEALYPVPFLSVSDQPNFSQVDIDRPDFTK